MSELYKGININEQGDDAPWGDTFNQSMKDVIDRTPESYKLHYYGTGFRFGQFNNAGIQPGIATGNSLDSTSPANDSIFRSVAYPHAVISADTGIGKYEDGLGIDTLSTNGFNIVRSMDFIIISDDTDYTFIAGMMPQVIVVSNTATFASNGDWPVNWVGVGFDTNDNNAGIYSADSTNATKLYTGSSRPTVGKLHRATISHSGTGTNMTVKLESLDDSVTLFEETVDASPIFSNINKFTMRMGIVLTKGTSSGAMYVGVSNYRTVIG